MTQAPLELEDLLAAHLAGESVSVPQSLKSDFDRALAGHQALAGMLAETALAADSVPDRPPPALPADYQIEREIGRGGMGVVYLVRQQSLGRRVALKVLRPGERTFGPLVQRFLEEARHLARLRHPHIVSIHEIGDADGEPYFTMDYVEGEPLSAKLKHGPLPPSQAVDVLKQVAEAVQHAHRHGIIHRDLKPANVLLDDSGQAFVTDFGLARDLSQAPNLTRSGELLGTPQYMAPEQARGDSVLIGEATDIHALGMILYEMLVGRTPYAAASAAETLARLLHQEPQPLRELDRRIPRDLETICLKMLHKHPSARYANISALLEDLRRYEAGEPLVARRPSQLAALWRWCRQHWKTAVTMAATAAVVLALAAWLFDKSYAELVAWGDEEVARGRPEIAAQVYLRALDRADETQQRELADRLVRVARSLNDPKLAVELADRIIGVVPEASFGKYDYLVAQSQVSKVRLKSPSGSIDLWQTTPSPELQLVKQRLEQALAGTLSETERTEVVETLEAVNLALSRDKPWARIAPDRLHTLPTGDEAELNAIVQNEEQALWNRGKAAMALGRMQERQRQRDAALASYRRAYELIRSVYPMTGGVKAARGANVSRNDAPDAEECQLVRDLADCLHRLAPQEFSAPRGGLQFAVEGVAIPATVGLDLTVVLCDPAVDNPHRGLPYNLPRHVPLQHDRPIVLPVLDGTYRLQVQGHHSRWEPDGERFSRLLQVDVEGWPKQVEIRGGMVSLPPVQLRLADEIQLSTPENGAALALRDAVLEWRPIAGAVRYAVQLCYTYEQPTPTQAYFSFPSTTEPRLRFSDLSDFEKDQVRKNFVPGRTGGWRVNAYDAQGRRIGTSLHERRFLIVSGLDDSP